MHEIFKNKKGGEKLFSIWWFFVLGIVGIGVVAGVLLFYSAGVDVRPTEALLLYDRIVDCITGQGFLIEDSLKNDFDIFSECNLNKEILTGEDFYFEINFLNDSKDNIRDNVAGGNNEFVIQCETQEDVKADDWAKCFHKSEGVLYYEDNQVKTATLDILTASNQKGEKISALEGKGGEFGGGGAEEGW